MRFQNPFVTLTISTLLISLGLITASPAQAEAVAQSTGTSTDKDQSKPDDKPAEPTVVPPTNTADVKGRRLRPILPVQSAPVPSASVAPQPDLVIPDSSFTPVSTSTSTLTEVTPAAPVAQTPAPSTIPAPEPTAPPADTVPAAPTETPTEESEPESDRDRQRQERREEKERRRQERAAEREARDRQEAEERRQRDEQRATEREERDRRRAEERQQREEEKQRQREERENRDDDDDESDEAPNETPAAPNNREEPPVSDTPNGVPDFLNPDPNPLSLPTTPEEVNIEGTQPITLNQAIALAVRNNPELQVTRLELEQARAQLKETQAQQNAPTLDLFSNLTLNVQEGADAAIIPGVASPANPRAGTAERDGNRFSTGLNLSSGLEANYNLFTFGRRAAAIRASEGRVRFQELKIEADTEQLILDTTTAYYDLQQADKEVLISQDSLKQAEQSLRDAQALERAGVGTRFDVLQAQVDVANSKQQLTQDLSQQEISRRRLVQRLNVAQTVTLSSAEEVAVAGSWDFSLQESIVQALKNRAELEQQLVQRDVGEQQRRSALASRRPQVALNARYTLENDLIVDGDTTGSRRSAVNNPESTEGEFFNNLQVGVRFSMRLSDGGVSRSQARQAQISIETAEAQFENVKTQIRRQVEEAHSTLISSQENIETTALAVTSANEALRLARLRFQAGVGTQSDVLRSQTELTRSRVNNLNAILSYNRALATLKRAVSNLPDGNLADTP
jgi:outer membrane protein TolC